jgi:membrane-bound lytic murein transglycosylase A
VLPATLRWNPAGFAELPGWAGDDMAAAWPAFLASCQVLRTRDPWRTPCEAANALPAAPDNTAVRLFFEQHFTPWHVAYDDAQGQPAREGLITGYYEPVLRGARQRGGVFQTPLHAVPDDLLTVELGELFPALRGERVRGRVQGRKVVPYPERAAVERHAPLRGREIVWVDDPVDAFFLQVQGSGRVTLPDGSVVRLAYADQNGQPYRAIGRYLVQRAGVPVAEADGPGIRRWLAANPARLREVLDTNPSVVFFREEALPDPTLGPKGALGVPLTAGRSIAIDPRNLPLGAPMFLVTTEPATGEPGSGAPLRRLVMAQDTGGAIRGVVRADLFWGLGHAAGEAAGRMRNPGQLWLLWPRGAVLPPPGPGVPPATATAATAAVALIEAAPYLEAVGRSLGQTFLLDPALPRQLRLGNADPATLSYTQLLALLRQQQIAAVRIEGVVNLVPEAQVRSLPLPVLAAEDDPTIAADEWVTRTVPLQHLEAAALVPALRPLLPVHGHLAAVPGSNAVVIVDRYANTRRVLATLRQLDQSRHTTTPGVP